METTRLGASVTKSHRPADTTPSGPDVLLFPVKPVNFPGICFTKTFFFASMTYIFLEGLVALPGIAMVVRSRIGCWFRPSPRSSARPNPAPSSRARAILARRKDRINKRLRSMIGPPVVGLHFEAKPLLGLL